MPQIGGVVRWSLVLVLAGGLASCGRDAQLEVERSAAPVRYVAAALAKDKRWAPGKCLCAGHFRDETIENFPAGLLDVEFQRYPFLRNWADCAPFYGRVKNMKGCEAGMVDYVCSVAKRPGLPEGTVRVLCHVSGESEALQKAGYLRDEFDVTGADGMLRAEPVSLQGSGMIHE